MSETNYPDDNIKEKIQTGDFFRESMDSYHAQYHDIMAERYFFLGVSALSLLMFMMALIGMIMLSPLKTDVPFIYSSTNVENDYPRIKALGSKEEDPNLLLKRFMVINYLKLREEYRVSILERNRAGVEAQSSEDVFQEYVALLDPRNPESPIKKYQRLAVRNIKPISYNLKSNEDGSQVANILYKEEVVTSGADISVRNMRAIITFSFENVKVNQTTGEASPIKFFVTGYQVEVQG